MSTQLEITRIQTARNKIRIKLVELGLVTSTAKIDKIADEIEKIDNQGAISATVQEGDTYTIPKGYHNGSGTVSGVSGGGNYTLQSKSVTPTKSQQNVTPDSGFFGLSDVTVAAIPESYQDVSSVTAEAGDVLSNKLFVNAAGEIKPGEMKENGTVTKKLDTTTKSYIIPEGHHSGLGTVSITTETKSVTPTKSAQNIIPGAGNVLSSVSVGAIPNEYVDTSDANATGADMLADKTAYVNGEKVTGSIDVNGAMNKTIDGLTTTSVGIPAGYTTGGTVSLTDDIENALAAI